VKAVRQTSEPSVEEILESIKKVIARDNRADEPRRGGSRSPAAEAQFSAEAEDEVLDLASLDLASVDEYSDGDVSAPGDDTAEAAPLIARPIIDSMRESLAMLTTMAAPGAAPQIVRSGETSIEGLVREMLRPMLAEWLDKNLPPLVERLVATEISRIVSKKG